MIRSDYYYYYYYYLSINNQPFQKFNACDLIINEAIFFNHGRLQEASLDEEVDPLALSRLSSLEQINQREISLVLQC